MSYINAHTHQLRNSETALVNLRPPYKDSSQLPPFYSVGIHPWDISGPLSIDHIKQYALNEKCLAIGETGLDRGEKYSHTLNEQKKVFKQHIQLAKTLSKPLVIHCVRAFSDLIEILTNSRPSRAIMFHDYNGNSEITKRLLKFDSYFSYGEKLFNENSKGYQALNTIPINRLLLETDDSSRSIECVYSKASELLKIELNQLIKQVESNFKEYLAYPKKELDK